MLKVRPIWQAGMTQKSADRADRDALVLKLYDSGMSPAEIIAKLTPRGIKTSKVYMVLREHRPLRERAKRTRTSPVPPLILSMHATGMKPRQIAKALKLSRQYVYMTLERDREEKANAQQ